MFIVIKSAVFAAALCADSLSSAVGYGLARARISALMSAAISAVCTLTLVVSLLIGDLVGAYIPEIITRIACCAILCLLGVVKLFGREKVSVYRPLSLVKAMLLALSMSLDGVAAGFGAGLAEDGTLVSVSVITLLFTFSAVFWGNKLGLRLSRSLPVSFARIGGLVLIVLGISKLL